MKTILYTLFGLLLVLTSFCKTHGEERILIAADNKVIEINRAGKVLDIVKFLN